MIDLFVDSGAFSAYTKKAKIDLDNYISFLLKNKKSIDVYACLDVIGDAGASLRNQQYMSQMGLEPIPCFHYGGDVNYLKKYLDRYEYVALGGVVLAATSTAYMKWLDEIFSKYICDNSGFPRVKIHGYALTSPFLMARYPWYSVDSATWLIGRFSEIMIPNRRNGRWIYDTPFRVNLSYYSTVAVERRLNSFAPKEKEIVFQYIHENGYSIGKSHFEKDKEIVIEPGLCNQYQLRNEFNAKFFLKMQESLPLWPWKFQTKNLGLGL